MVGAAKLGGLTVGEVVRSAAHAADWLRACGIDPTAAGSLPIPAACADAGLDSCELADGLSTLASEHVTLSRVELDRLCRYIVLRHHDYIRRHVPRIQAALESIPASPPGATSTSLPHLFASMAFDLIAHLAKEENILHSGHRQADNALPAPLSGGPSTHRRRIPSPGVRPGRSHLQRR